MDVPFIILRVVCPLIRQLRECLCLHLTQAFQNLQGKSCLIVTTAQKERYCLNNLHDIIVTPLHDTY